MFRRLIWIIILILAGIVPLILRVPHTQAATIDVTNGNDSGIGSLRAAIILANSTSEPDTINISAIVSDIVLTGELPPVTEPVTIQVEAPVTIDGGASITNGLVVAGSDSIIYGLTFTGFENGLLIQGANNTVGGTSVNQPNSFRNNGNGIVIEGAAAVENRITGNTIGTTSLPGSLANSNYGILIRNGAERNIIGQGLPDGNTCSDNLKPGSNIITGNTLDGIRIEDSDFNEIQNNYIGLGASGAPPAVQNGQHGIALANARKTLINHNFISRNTSSGVRVESSTDTTITNNRIGCTPFGALIPGSNGSSGITLLDSAITFVTQNTIVSNVDNGVLLDAASLNTVQNNIINNNGHGIYLQTLASDNTILSNTISDNISDGVYVRTGNRNLISKNIISGSGEPGIDLEPNGPDVSPGANNGQLTPVITNVQTDTAGRLLIDGTLETTTTGLYTLEVFQNTSCVQQAETYLASTTVTSPGAGILPLSLELNNTIPTGGFITITATDPFNNTSQLSICAEVTLLPIVAGFTAVPISGTAPLTVDFMDTSTGTIDTYLWDFGDGNTSTVQNPPHEYDTADTYTVRLTVDGPTGIDFIEQTITVTAPDAPVAGFSANPISGDAPLTVDFTDASTGIIDTYLWEFGDGETSTLENPTHTFDTPDTYTVRLTVSGPGGNSTTTRTITVSQPDVPTNTPVPPPTNTPAPPPTNTPIPSNTPTFTPAPTDTPTFTPLPTNTPTFTFTPIPTATNTPTFTPVPTSTPTATPTEVVEVDVEKDSDSDDDLQIDVINRGTNDLDDVVLIEELREQVIFLSVRTGSPGCLERGGIVICELGTIPGGDTASVDLRVDSNGTDPTSGRTTVTVGGVPVGVIDEPYISKIGSPPVAGPGTDVTYTIRVINPTTDTARSLVVEDDMPVSLEVLSAESTSGSVSVNGQVVRFTQGTLAPGGQITITVQTRVRDDGDFNNIINQACLTSSSNPSPSCAQMQFLRASALPATGETPPLPQRIVQIVLPLAALLIVVLGGWIVLNRSRVEA